MRRLAPFLRKFFAHRLRMALGMACIPLAAGFDILLTVLVGDALDRLRAGNDASFLRGLFLLMLAISLVRGIFRFLHRWWIVGVSRRFEVELKQELFDKLCSLGLPFHVRSRSGDVVSRLTSDVENLRMLLGPGTMYVLGALVLVPGSLFVLFQISPSLTIWIALPLALIGFAMKRLSPRLHRHSTAVQASLAEISHRAQETFSGIRVVKGYGLTRHEDGRFEETSRTNRGHQIALAKASGLTHSAVNFAHQLAFVPILLVGGLAMIDRDLAAGDLFKFIDLAHKVFWPVLALGWMAGIYPRAVASAERIDDLLHDDTFVPETASPRPLSGQGALSLERVSFTYHGAKRPALQNVSVEVPAGTTLGIVGPTGAGKTTLLSMIARLLEGDGKIALDGVPLADLSLGSLRGALGVVPQDAFLFADTVRANLDFGAAVANEDAELWRLLKMASIEEEVGVFDGGLDQLIGERGVTLSGGQRQRMCIARALAGNPRVLLLDDTLSAVDTETEARLISNLHAAGDGRTVLVAAHRLGSVRHAERILVLIEGRVDASGTHDELVQSCPWYRDTWRRQCIEEEIEEL